MFDYNYDNRDAEYKEALERYERKHPDALNLGFKICFMLRSMTDKERKEVLGMIYEEFIKSKK